MSELLVFLPIGMDNDVNCEKLHPVYTEIADLASIALVRK